MQKELHRRAFWALFGGVAMFLSFSLLPLICLLWDLSIQVAAVAALYFTGSVAPTVAWLMLEKLTPIEREYPHEEKMGELADMGRQLMLWANPVGWIGQIIFWGALKAALRWPALALAVAVFIS